MTHLFLGLALAFSAPSAEVDTPAPSVDIVETARAAGSFNTLLTAVEAAGLVDVLRGDGPFTVFAPTDEAFAKVPADQLEALLADKEALKAVLLYHVVPGAVNSGAVVNLTAATTVNGQDVSISVDDGTVMVDNATVTSVDIEASNGIIHVIDSVILPQM
ncbi:MAG: fasciclin domain-containing protein [Longimicrobiales bacterium]